MDECVRDFVLNATQNLFCILSFTHARAYILVYIQFCLISGINFTKKLLILKLFETLYEMNSFNFI